MSTPKVVLYDIASKHATCNSPNTWKTRLVLNYKGIPYETRWLEYPEVEPFLKGMGIEPFPEGTSYKPFTLPVVTIYLPDGKQPLHIMDSLPIAKALEEHFPEPSLYVSSPTTEEAETLMRNLMVASFPAYMPLIPKVLNPVSAEYYHRERSALMGASLDAIYAAKGAEAFDDSKQPLQAWTNFLKQDDSGPFVKGNEPNYADFIFAGWLAAVKIFNADAFEKFVGFDDSLQKVWEATSEWRKRDSY